ncbi:MAG: hypothetical protein FJX76_24125 [Armatimonadetes bacterium]|nr:hypothetical protein [Armatimonadota bacterium]
MSLSIEQLRDVRDTLQARVLDGLAENGREIKALPTFLGPPEPEITGRAVVVDIGGSNVRAALVDLQGDGKFEVLGGPIHDEAPGREGPLDAEGFFDAQARLVARLPGVSGLPLGYCFSYPARNSPDGDATLIHWTKGMHVTGVEGTRVGKALVDALARHDVAVPTVRVLNDTVASLLGGTAGFAHEGYDRFIGLIVGTGTNMAGFFRQAQIPKLDVEGPHDLMAVNLESGNYRPPHLCAIDDALDAESDNPGLQRLEKAVSGSYLPFVFQKVCAVPGFDPHKGSAQLVQMRDSRPDSPEGRAAAAVLRRSAQLTAAGLAGVGTLYHGAEKIGILAEGTLFWGDQKYADHVREILRELLDVPADLLRLQNVNLIGAGAAALT